MTGTPAPGTGTPLPMAVPAPGLPAMVRIHEVGARDGLQNEKTVVPTEVKAEFIRRLAVADRGDQLRAPEVGAPARRRRTVVPDAR